MSTRDVLVNPVLTKAVVGVKYPGFIAREVLPIVDVQLPTGYIAVIKDGKFVEVETMRANGADPNEIRSAFDQIKYAVEEHALSHPLDKRNEIYPAEKSGANAVLKLKLRAAGKVDRLLQLSLERCAADTLFNPNNYSSAQKITLTGTDKFSDQEMSDPCGVLIDARDKAKKAMGILPNTLVLGADMFADLNQHPAILKILSNVVSGNKLEATPEDLAKIFRVAKVVVGEAIGQGGYVWGNCAAFVYVPGHSEEAPFHTCLVEDPKATEVQESDRNVAVDIQKFQKYQVLNCSQEHGFLVVG